MTLKAYQTTITMNTLYNAAASGVGSEQLAPNIEIIGGNADVYVSQTKPLSAPTGMYKIMSAVTGIQPFTLIPNYLYVSGSGLTLTLSGVNASLAT